MEESPVVKLKTSVVPEQELMLMTQHQLDSTTNKCFGWVVLACTSLSSCLYRGMQRSLGIFFNELKTTYGVDRKTLTSIMGLILALDQFTAPVSGYLVMQFSCRSVSVMGSLCLAGGLIISYFIKDLAVLFLMGVMLGVGLGFCDISATVILSYYFKNRPTASQGVRLAGATLGGALMPITLLYLLNIYHLHGALLLTGGLMLNIAAFGLLYELPRPNKSLTSHHQDEEPDEEHSRKLPENYIDKNKISNKESFVSNNVELDNLLVTNKEQKSLEQFNHNDSSIGKVDKTPLPINPEQEKWWHINVKNKKLQPYLLLLTSSVFYMYIFASSSFVSGFRNFMFILPAHGEDQNLDKTQAALLLTVLSIHDLIGRLSFGWIVDGFKLNRHYCHFILCLTNGIITLCLPFFKTFTILVIFISVIGLLYGCAAPICISLYIKTFGQDFLYAARGIEGIFGGVMNLCISYLVGYLADRYQSFNPAFYFIGSLLISSAFIILLYPFGMKQDNKRKAHKINTAL